MTTAALTPLEEAIVARIAQEAAAQPAAAAIWVFGSRARGASTEYSDFDVAVEFSSAETPALREWLAQVRRAAEEPVADEWPGFLDLVGLYAGDVDSRLARQVFAGGMALWQRRAPQADPTSAAAPREVALTRP